MYADCPSLSFKFSLGSYSILHLCRYVYLHLVDLTGPNERLVYGREVDLKVDQTEINIPTFRNTAIGACSFAGRVGAVMAPPLALYLPNIQVGRESKM